MPGCDWGDIWDCGVTVCVYCNSHDSTSTNTISARLRLCAIWWESDTIYWTKLWYLLFILYLSQKPHFAVTIIVLNGSSISTRYCNVSKCWRAMTVSFHKDTTTRQHYNNKGADHVGQKIALAAFHFVTIQMFSIEADSRKSRLHALGRWRHVMRSRAQTQLCVALVHSLVSLLTALDIWNT